MKIYNTLTRRLEEFEPIEGKRARMYTCGPTVYDYAHIGNFRAYVFEDILRRHLEWSGYEVMQVMNLTDVDDKTIKGAREKGVPLKEYTSEYVKAFFNDLEALNIEKAEIYPAATDHVEEMIALIDQIIKKGHAYVSEEGSVYYDVNSFANYGRLSGIQKSGLKAGARIASDEYEKANVADFALWKAWSEEDGDVVWESPWGRGRPGWHIECSAMSTKYLGESFDIHTGGIDNMFPHHENEIAQSEAASGKPFVKYWMHCGYLVVDGAKMSKSLGNFHTLRQILEKGYEGRDLRYILASAHYRQPLNFTFDALDAARSSLQRLDDYRERLETVSGGTESPAEAPGWAEEGRRGFRAALDDDLNMPEALGSLFAMVHSGNRALDRGDIGPGEAKAAFDTLVEMDRVTGVLGRKDSELDGRARELLEARGIARSEKRWDESDRIRDELAELGWEVRDTSDGQKVKRNSG